MASQLPPHEDAELRMSEIAAAAGPPEPDEVEYRDGEIVLIWREQKLAVVVELEGHPLLERGDEGRQGE